MLSEDTGDLGLGDIVEEKDENGETKEVTNTPVSGPLINLQGDDKMELDEKKGIHFFYIILLYFLLMVVSLFPFLILITSSFLAKIK